MNKLKICKDNSKTKRGDSRDKDKKSKGKKIKPNTCYNKHKETSKD